MAREGGTVIENQFTRGLVTEATGMNYPEHAAIDALNVKFTSEGQVTRRRGIDLEDGWVFTDYDTQVGVIREFVWQAVGGTGGATYLVMQKGEEVLFFELNQDGALSAGEHSSTLVLDDYKAAGAPDIRNLQCSFASGSGYLYVAHPFCDPVIVRYNSTANTFEAAKITIRIRDMEGLEDGLAPRENPATLSTNHHYNLKNQGWDQQVRVGSTTNEIGAGGSTSPTPTGSLTWETLS